MVVDGEILRLALEVALGVAAAAIGWFLRVVIDRLQRIESAMIQDVAALNELRVVLAKDYITKDDHKSALDNIFNALRRIEDKLDKKVDKP